MFMGTYEHGLDAKGRVIIPAKLREDLGESFVVTLGLDGCLFAYPMNEWEGFIEKLKRHFLANAAPCELDKQGRALIPAKLREYAGLAKETVFVGVLSKIEIWSKERWDENDDYDNIDDIAEHMSEFGLSF